MLKIACPRFTPNLTHLIFSLSLLLKHVLVLQSFIWRDITFDLSVTHLDLYRKNIDAAGAVSLASALRNNSTITYLNLSANSRFGDEGAASLAAALCNNSTIAIVFLGHTGIGDAGAVSLAAALRTVPTLSSLWLRHNDISAETQQSIRQTLAHVGDLYL